MRLLAFEMKKIWQPKIVMALLALCVMYGFLVLSFPLTYFQNGLQITEQYKLMKRWAQKYGTMMDAGERIDAENELEILHSEAERYISVDSRLTGLHIYSWDEYYTLRVDIKTSSEASPEDHTIADLLYTEEFDYIGQSIDTLSSALYTYDMRNEHLLNSRFKTDAEYQRVADIVSADATTGIMFYGAIENFCEYSRWGTILIVFSIVILLAPSIVRDRYSGMQQLQWSSAIGRKIINKQLAAIILSAFILVFAELSIMSALYALTGTQYFWDNPLTTFFYVNIFWFEMTYGQYVVFIAVFAILVSLGAVGIVFCLSRYSGNYTMLLFKIVPAFALLAIIISAGIQNLFSFNNSIYALTHIVGIEAYIPVCIFITGVVCAVFTVSRDKIQEFSAPAFTRN